MSISQGQWYALGFGVLFLAVAAISIWFGKTRNNVGRIIDREDEPEYYWAIVAFLLIGSAFAFGILVYTLLPNR